MTVTRVDYKERQRLTAADLRAEQDYRLALSGRHHLAPHDWGVVSGLHVTLGAGLSLVISPGLAIDGYGREILVPESVECDTEKPLADKPRSVLLYYCESPEAIPPKPTCNTATRISQGYVVRVVESTMDEAVSSARLDLARAGGAPTGVPPWPVLLAQIGPNRQAENGRVRYLRQRAAIIQAASSRAVLQLGLKNAEDVYHFALSTRDGTQASPIRRVAIDRDGSTHVWRSLVLTGPHTSAGVALTSSRRAIFKMATRAGIGVSPVIEGHVNGGFISHLRLVDRSASLLPSRQLIISAKMRRGVDPVPALRFGGRKAFIAVVNADTQGPPPKSFSTSMRPYGGRLDLGVNEAAQAQKDEEPLCGDLPRFRNAREVYGPVLQLRPGVGLKETPTAREFHTVTVSSPSEIEPRTETRISGGAEDSSDTSSRVSIGKVRDGAWVSAVEMDGTRGIRLPAPKGALSVNGTIYLPEIGRSDPLLPELMALAQMAGLYQKGSTIPGLTATFKNVTSPLQRGHEFSYVLKFTTTSMASVVLKQAVELIVGCTPGRGEFVFDRMPGFSVPIGGGDTDVFHRRPLKHRAKKVEIRVAMLLKRGGVTGVVLAQSGGIHVDD